MSFINMILITLSTNLIFSKAIGISTMIIAAKNKTNLILLSIVITAFTTIGSMLTYIADKFFLAHKYNLLFLPLAYVLIIALLYVASLLIIRALSERFFHKIKKYIHYSAFNTVVLGSLLLCSNLLISTNQDLNSFSNYVFSGLINGLGFLIATYLLKISQIKLDSEEIPKSFRGYPILLIYIGIISMALYNIKR